MSSSDYTIRQVQANDYEAWAGLWKSYLDFYNTKLPEAQYRNTFDRLLSTSTSTSSPPSPTDPSESSHPTYSPGGIYGLLLISPSPNSQPVGLAHYLFHSSAWSSSPTAQCYLNDLYVSPDHRGRDLAERLIREVEVRVKRAEVGCGRVYWLTQPGNERARKVYDRVCSTEAGAEEGGGEVDGGAERKKRTGGLMDRVVYKIDLPNFTHDVKDAHPTPLLSKAA